MLVHLHATHARDTCFSSCVPMLRIFCTHNTMYTYSWCCGHMHTQHTHVRHACEHMFCSMCTCSTHVLYTCAVHMRVLLLTHACDTCTWHMLIMHVYTCFLSCVHMIHIVADTCTGHMHIMHVYTCIYACVHMFTDAVYTWFTNMCTHAKLHLYTC